MDLLSSLNPAQRQAVTAGDGPVLVLAGPGSGKTRVLTHRIAYMIEERGVDPFHIIAVTFTNKAAREMKERLDHILGAGRAAALTVGTFHSICARFLRRDIQHLGRERDFAIYDSDDQQRVMKRVLRDLSLDEKKNSPRAIHATISRAKNELVDAAEFARHARTGFDQTVARCYERYQALLRESNALDFDDLLFVTQRLFELHPDVLAHYHRRYTYVLADEYQDTNRAQYVLLKQIAAGHKNIFVVGDEDQCLPAGALVRTSLSDVPIERVQEGDLVMAGAGRGTVAQGRVEKTYARPYRGEILRVTLADGREVRLTPNHMCFARLGVREDSYYVYLMFRRDKGYRVGLTRGYRSEGSRYGFVNGLQVRVRQEHADKAWILRACADREEAAYYEHYYAVRYGIPAMVFDVAGREGMSFTRRTIDRRFASIDTHANAERLMADLGIYEDYPHYRPGGASESSMPDRMLVHLTAFGGNPPSEESPWFRHRVWLNTTDRAVEQQVVGSGLMTRAGQRETWRIERSFRELDRTADLAEQIAEAAGGIDVARWAMLTDAEKFALQPAAHLRPGMIVPAWKDWQIVDAEIASVDHEEYDGLVYDLDVAELRNFVANGVVVHNSIYAFRGADIRNIRSFEKDYPSAEVIELRRNYRSTQAILDVAQAVINRSAQRHRPKVLETSNGAGVSVQLLEGYDQDEEGQLVAAEIGRLVASGEYRFGDIAIMYRTNAQSRAVEEALVARGMRYVIVGGTRFYERKEVKDALAYIRLAHNPFDGVSLARVLNWPARGIGERTQDELERRATVAGVPVYVALQLLADTAPDAQDKTFNARTKAALAGFLKIADELIAARDALPLGELIDLLLARVGFQEALIREYGEEEGADRWNNVLELRNVADNYVNLPREAQLPTFLEEVALVADVDQIKEDQDSITCITLHQAKGLEYPVVFLVGLEEGLLPHSRSVDDREALDEERRLLYVGVTRAKERLYLLYAFRRQMYGRAGGSAPSRFLADIPKELVKQLPKRGYAPAQQTTMFSGRGWGAPSQPPPAGARRAQPAPPARAPQPAPRERPAPAPQAAGFFAGQKVRHATFGEGIVVTSKLVDGDEEVTVAFPGQGVKRLLASFAKLEKAE